MKGLSVSQGIAIGVPYCLEPFKWPKEQLIGDKDKEIGALKVHLKEAAEALKALHIQMEEAGKTKQAAIMDAHRMLIEDEEYLNEIIGLINEKGYSEIYAIYMATEYFAETFRALNNDYFRERAHDMMDVGKRLIRVATGQEETAIEALESGTIIVAKDLEPSVTARINPNNVIAFITEEGGKTSHTAIMANVMGIPAVSGIQVEEIFERAHKNEELKIIVDGDLGEIFLNPNTDMLNEYEEKKQLKKTLQAEMAIYKERDAITTDGHKVKVTANIMLPEHAEVAMNNGADGIGLFRSEFLYMNKSHEPSEDQQFLAYKQVAKVMAGKEVIIRTLDVGGDKAIDYLHIHKEMNPFLGYRAIRYCLEHEVLFLTQIRAILRASAFGKLSIMFPMISGLEELLKAKELVEKAKIQLIEEGIAFDESIRIGIMIEVPSAAIISDQLAKHCDFFSIGTNDLIQYTLAVDRMNEKIKALYNPSHRAVLRLIAMTIRNGHKENIEVGMCGSSAEDNTLIPILLGMGLDKFSVNPSKVPQVKKQITELSYKECQNMIIKY